MKTFFYIIFSILLASCSSSTIKELTPIRFAWIDGPHQFEVVLNNNSAQDTSIPYTLESFNKSISLKDDQGKSIPIVRMRYLKKNRIQLITGINIPLNRNYYFTQNSNRFYAYPSKNLLNTVFYYKGELGAVKHGNMWRVTLWSPTSTDVILKVYQANDQRRLVGKRTMSLIAPGVWQIDLKPSSFKLETIDNYYYQFELFAFGEKRLANDPYSLSMANHANKDSREFKSAFIDLTEFKKTNSLKKYISNRKILKGKQFLGYEGHIRDFSITQKSVPENLRGTYQGLTSILPHVKKLNVTHLQLMPLFFFPTVEESNRSFQSSLQTFSSINYNWGYDTQNFFTPSGFYSENAYTPQKRIAELFHAIHEIQDQGIGVILDVVYNHLYDGLKFENSAPGCYLRRSLDGKISTASGAGYSFDSTIYMARRMILDSLDFYHNFYHINGFRFDLMSFIDQETMELVRKRLGDDVILYGEGWNNTDLPKNMATTMHQLPNIKLGAFSDQARDAIIGTLGTPGAVLGNARLLPAIRSVISGSTKGVKNLGSPLSGNSFHQFAPSPQEAYLYLDIHDGPTLWDKVDSLSTLPRNERWRRIKQAYAVLLTSQGQIILQAGSEFGRRKITSDKDGEKTTIFYGNENPAQPLQSNSYRHSDTTNGIDWEMAKNPDNAVATISTLSKLRNSHSHFALRSKEEVESRLKFIQGEDIAPEAAPQKIWSNFSELNDLTIHFINGPKNKTMYISGELIPDYLTTESDKNPSTNPYQLKFDENGVASITLSKTQIADSNLEAWSNPEALNIKLVLTPGAWETLPSAYQGLGNNEIPLYAVDKERNATIDLKTTNASAAKWENKVSTNDLLLAYRILGEKRKKESDLLILHNFSDKSLRLTNLKVSEKWRILFSIDSEADAVSVENGIVTIKAHQSAIISI